MRYRTIIADPPWQYRNAGIEGAAENHYPTMATPEIAALPVGKLAAPDAVLLLWATWPMLSDAMRVVDAWGFTYISGFPWIKLRGIPRLSLFGDVEMLPSYGQGWWIRGCSEPILICKRGNTVAPNSLHLGLISDRFAHSRKPENLYEYAETLPGPYLELFARRPRTGWDQYGNEMDGAIALSEVPA